MYSTRGRSCADDPLNLFEPDRLKGSCHIFELAVLTKNFLVLFFMISKALFELFELFNSFLINVTVVFWLRDIILCIIYTTEWKLLGRPISDWKLLLSDNIRLKHFPMNQIWMEPSWTATYIYDFNVAISFTKRNFMLQFIPLIKHNIQKF